MINTVKKCLANNRCQLTFFTDTQIVSKRCLICVVVSELKKKI